MANKFEITISALDRATAVVRKVSQALNRITAPISRLKASMRTLSVELGLDRIRNGLMTVSRHVQDATRGLFAMLTPISALLGFSTAAGVLNFSNAWARLAQSLTQASAASGVAVGPMQKLMGAGKLVGIEAETTAASLASLAGTMQDARFGRNSNVLAMMNQLGMKFRLTKDGAIDAARSFEDIARAVSSPKIANNPAVQKVIAGAFGMESMLPLLRQGEAGIKKFTEIVAQSGYVMDDAATKRGAGFAKSLSILELAAGGLRNTIGDRLIPILQPLIEKLTAWVVTNRDLIASKVATVVQELADALKAINWGEVIGGIKGFVGGVREAVEFVGGWKVALLGVVGIMAAPALAAVVGLGGEFLKLGALLSGTMVAGIGKVGGALATQLIAPVADATGKIGGLTKAAFGALNVMNNLGIVAAVGSTAYAAGSLVAKGMEGTKYGDAVGSGVAKTLAFFGNDEAKASVARMNGETAPATASPYRKPAADSQSPPAAAKPSGEPSRIEILLRGLPAGATAVMTGGSTAVNLRIGDSMPTELTP